MKEIKVQSSGRTLEGVLFGETTPILKPAAILLHGWRSAQDRMFDLAKILSEDLGYIILTINLGGHGESDGKIGELSRKDFLDDLIAAYDFLENQNGVDKNKIGILGSSFGGYLAPLLSSKRKIFWIAMRVPADYPDNDFALPKIPSDDKNREEINSWRQQKKTFSETMSLAALHDFNGKVLIVESEHDELVPHQTVQNFVDAVTDKENLEYHLMLDTPHSITKYPELKIKFNQLVVNWLQK